MDKQEQMKVENAKLLAENAQLMRDMGTVKQAREMADRAMASARVWEETANEKIVETAKLRAELDRTVPYANAQAAEIQYHKDAASAYKEDACKLLLQVDVVRKILTDLLDWCEPHPMDPPACIKAAKEFIEKREPEPRKPKPYRMGDDVSDDAMRA